METHSETFKFIEYKGVNDFVQIYGLLMKNVIKFFFSGSS